MIFNIVEVVAFLILMFFVGAGIISPYYDKKMKRIEQHKKNGDITEDSSDGTPE